MNPLRNKPDVLNKLSTGEATFVLTSKKLDPPDIEQRIIFTDDIILAVPANHAWAGKPFVYLDDILNEPVILREESSGSRELILAALQEYRIAIEDLTIVMELGNAEAIENAVENGIGIAFISRLASTRSLKLGNIVEITVEGLEIKQKIYMVRNKTMAPTHVQQKLWEFASSQKILDQTI